jgi:hypothetical protein
VDSPSKGQCFRTPTLAAPKLHRSETRLPDSTSRTKKCVSLSHLFSLQNEDGASAGLDPRFERNLKQPSRNANVLDPRGGILVLGASSGVRLRKADEADQQPERPERILRVVRTRVDDGLT